MEKKRIKLHIKKGDKVQILSGDSKGAIGTVARVFTETNRAIVEGEGIRKAKRHVRPSAQTPGGIVDKDIPVHISNLMLVDSQEVPSRVSREKREVDGKMKTVRVSKKTKEVIE
jgi:large subunit ribosomal protein L24